MFTRDRVANWLGWAGIAAVFLSVMPSFEYRGGTVSDRAQADHLKANPGDLPYTEDYVFGWADSPLVHYHSELALAESAGGFRPDRSRGVSIGWLSWSSLTLAVGLGLLWAARRIRPGTPGV